MLGFSPLSVKEVTDLRDELVKDGVYDTLDTYYLDREDSIARALERTSKLIRFWVKKGVYYDRDSPIQRATALTYADLGTTSFLFHYSAFMRTIELIGDED